MTPHLWMISSNPPLKSTISIGAGRSHPLTPAEKKRRFEKGLCLCYGGNDHKWSGCQLLKNAGGVARAALVQEVEEGVEDQSGQDDSL